ncbi:MAG: hypothetical protein PWR20_2157 [Bacteroidales bacterium]|jgi:tRNA-splicing ligase RtcB|nr:hypothetical protein [Bacteroidales bacterium]MDN5330126.1 hypothetical protein [Bacteroidales bacterium]NLH52841.1 RtcB family protein [Bacteroidales bacterium]NPV35664.1 RtcB family protein [Bacteroidales bacterium]
MKILEIGKLPVYMWAEDVEAGAMQQINNLSMFPYAFHHIAIMPDCHEGFGMPIGGVLSTRDVIIPNAVGVDIGCGMCAMRTDLKEIDVKSLNRIFNKLRELIPLGFNHQTKKQDEAIMPKGYDISGMPVVKKEWEEALYQLGTLGGGNHFIEIQKGSDGYIWAMIHSGSRNLGKQVADFYNKLAISFNEKEKSTVPKSHQLAYLRIDSKEGRQYNEEMKFCVEFALANRKLMMERIASVLEEETHCGFISWEGTRFINIAHNYAAEEEHFGCKVIVHRKGATRALRGETGIVPGSQGSKSYIVKGKGNPESFMSCSHGAGRKMGRNEARKKLNLEEERRKLESKKIIHALRTPADLDEASGAYKDIDLVMKLQADLVDICIELTPLGVIKG